MASPPAGLPRLELVCFGPPTARLDGQEPPPAALWRKHLALLTYLALSPGRTRSRQHLHGLLWPEKTQAQAQHSLNEAVRLLRASLGAGRLVSREDSLTLHDEGLDVDAWRIEADPAAVRGEFLEGLALRDAPAFEEWAAAQRARFRSRSVAALVTAGEDALLRCRYAHAGDAAQAALALEPFAESAVQLLMRARALAGDSASALAAFHAFADRLAAELGEQPGRELSALSERVRTRRWRPASPGGAEIVDDAPLVGREGLYHDGFALVASALSEGGGPRVLFITGDPGSGKSRFLETALERAALGGALVARLRPLESDSDAPWSALRALLREGGGGLLNLPGVAAAAPEAFGVVEHPAEDHGQVAAAFASLLRAACDEQPVAIGVDDAHYADGATLAALGAAVARLGTAPLLLVVAALEALDQAPRELWRLRAEVGRSLPGRTLRLGVLLEAEVRQLVEAMAQWCPEGEQRDRLARRLAFETGGSPFLAVTLLRALHERAALRADLLAWPPARATMESPLPITAPDLARYAIAARVADLDDAALAVLQAASVGGIAVDRELVAAVSDVPRAELDAVLAGLERRHFLRFDGARYVFAAPLIAQVVRGECIAAGRRRALRERALAALQGRADLESRVLRAELRAKVEPGPAAFDETLGVARAALDAGSARSARRALAAAARAAEGRADALGPLAELRERVERS